MPVVQDTHIPCFCRCSQCDGIPGCSCVRKLLLIASTKAKEVLFVSVPDNAVGVKCAAVRCQHDQIFQCTAVINKQLHCGKTVFLAEIQLNPIGWIRRICFILCLRLVVANNKIFVVIMTRVAVDDQRRRTSGSNRTLIGNGCICRVCQFTRRCCLLCLHWQCQRWQHAQQHDDCQKKRQQAPAEKAGSFYHFISSLLNLFFQNGWYPVSHTK